MSVRGKDAGGAEGKGFWGGFLAPGPPRSAVRRGLKAGVCVAAPLPAAPRPLSVPCGKGEEPGGQGWSRCHDNPGDAAGRRGWAAAAPPRPPPLRAPRHRNPDIIPIPHPASRLDQPGGEELPGASEPLPRRAFSLLDPLFFRFSDSLRGGVVGWFWWWFLVFFFGGFYSFFGLPPRSADSGAGLSPGASSPK